MRILGVNISHNPSICLYEDGVIEEFYSEERFIFKKNIELDENFKIFQSIEEKIKDKIDLVCYASYGRNKAYLKFSDQQIINKIQRQLNFPHYYFDEREHHLYHAISAYYFSPFDEAVAIVVDGGGSSKYHIPYEEIESIYFINDQVIIPKFKHSTNNRTDPFSSNKSTFDTYKFNDGYLNRYSNTLVGGALFRETCKQVGFKDGHDAGKVMGLASYAYSKQEYNINMRHVNLAARAQEKSFEDTCLLIDRAKKDSNNILLSGGYFLNCSNNFKYVKKYPELNFFVDPIPHDPGTAIGAAIYYDNYKRRV